MKAKQKLSEPAAASPPETRPDSSPKTVEYNDLDLNRWKEYESISTDSLWLIDSRDRSNGHQLDYHGNYVPQIATQTFTRFSKAGEVILDLFLGSGTSAIEALRLGRRCIGVELKTEQADYVRAKLPAAARDKTIHIIEGDSSAPSVRELVRARLRKLKSSHCHLLVLHPPYHDIIQFSPLAEDLSNATSTEEFLTRFRQVAENGYELLAPGRFAVLIIGDKYAQGELVPLGFLCMQEMNKVGFLTKSIVVKNIEGNEKGKGRTANLWRYRALVGGFYIFKHEYVIVLQKPARRAKR